MLQVKSREELAALDEILAVKGIDGVFIGVEFLWAFNLSCWQ